MKPTSVQVTTTSDYDGDGSIDSRFLTTTTYDRQGHELTSTSENDYDGDGSIDSYESTTRTYDR
ncbi:MAG: hypothetical protein SFY66_09020 [Oculatellaceae cyanobacterium bins.114]|nr:hypothetical protein [Oculatellaceae cyanobacterium bins.114]